MQLSVHVHSVAVQNHKNDYSYPCVLCCVRPQHFILGQIYNKKSNCANAQRVFCYKNKKKVVFISLFKKKGLFLPHENIH